MGELQVHSPVVTVLMWLVVTQVCALLLMKQGLGLLFCLS